MLQKVTRKRGQSSAPPSQSQHRSSQLKDGSGSGSSSRRSNNNTNNGTTNNNDKRKRAQFWIWMAFGVVCSFISVDYSLRSLMQVALPTSNTAETSPLATAITTTATTSSSDENSMEAALLPLQAHQNTDYAFDSTAPLEPDPNQHAILIPYRDRKFHLELFLEYMAPYLQYHFPDAKFTLWIIEQDDTELFNRAWLANVGLREIVKSAPRTSCVVFHDVDLVPNSTSHVPYTTCQYPMQLGSELQHFNWSVPYPAYCGGITSLSLKHWQLINGIGNDYIGWGGEDDDLYHRLRINGLLLDSYQKDRPPQPRRPAKGHGVFRTLTQKAEHHVQTKQHNQYWKTLELLKQMYENSDRWKFDGMNDVYYTVTGNQLTVPELGFQQVRHIKAIPQKPRTPGPKYPKTDAPGDKQPKPLANLEFVHVPYTGGQAITTTASKAGMVWGACHFAAFSEWKCPLHKSGDFALAPFAYEASYQQAQRPWHIPLSRFSENPMEGTKRFTVVRHPYSRAISFYRFMYDAQHGYPHGYKYHEFVENKNHPPLEVAQYIIEREHPDKLNAFLQDFLYQAHHPHRHTGVELIPQVQFVYSRGVKYVHHVLHYEFLQRDFSNLMEKYMLNDKMQLPPPDRKRKRKKAVVKKYNEKRQPRVTKTWSSFVMAPITRFLPFLTSSGTSEQQQQQHDQEQETLVVDMSLAEIEDEYLLGAQDLADTTIAMLNDHFELDFRKFHYAKIKVNATTDVYWNKIQVIPRESTVAKQQAERNEMLKKQQKGGGGGGGAAAKPAPAKAQPKPIPREPQRKHRHEDKDEVLEEQKKKTVKRKHDKEDDKDGDASNNEGGQEEGDQKEETADKEKGESGDNNNGDNDNNNNNKAGDASNEDAAADKEQDPGQEEAGGAGNTDGIVDNLMKHAELQQQREEEQVGKEDEDKDGSEKDKEGGSDEEHIIQNSVKEEEGESLAKLSKAEKLRHLKKRPLK